FGVLFQVATRGQRVARALPEAADVQQRIRVAVDMLRRDLLAAGAGPAGGPDSGPLDRYFAAIIPARTGDKDADAELTYFTDRISILAVPEGGIAARLATDMVGPTADVPIDRARPGCGSSGLCGFLPGTRSVIFDGAGLAAGVDVF